MWPRDEGIRDGGSTALDSIELGFGQDMSQPCTRTNARYARPGRRVRIGLHARYGKEHVVEQRVEHAESSLRPAGPITAEVPPAVQDADTQRQRAS